MKSIEEHECARFIEAKSKLLSLKFSIIKLKALEKF